MVELIKFRVKNYKSIKDSGYCYLDSNITLLAGKNEAGKTSILEALEDFNTNKSIREDAVPLQDEKLKPEIEVELKLNREDLNKIEEKFGINIGKPEFITTVTKQYPNTYAFTEEDIKLLLSEKFETIKKIADLISRLKDKVPNFPLDETYLSNINQRPNLQAYNPQWKSGLSQEDLAILPKEVEELKLQVKSYNSIKEFQLNFPEFFKKTLIPNFILFQTFEDKLPNQISIAQAQANPLIKDLSLISNLDFAVIQPSTDPRKREKHREEINIRFFEDYKQFWSQDDSKLHISWESGNLYFFIKEGIELYKPEMRSKGRQWHLAFYIRVSARSVEEQKNIILIDEPGLFLHAKAQRDILKKLEECSKRNQIIFTTHSPYLIERDKLNRVRLVIKDENGTKIEKITAKADKETLTPILTAIGEDLSSGIRVDKQNSIVIEGYSDYLWLLSFKKLLNIHEELNFVPAVGAGSAVHVGSILFGWGLDPIFILDNDQAGNDTKRKLEEKLSINKENILSVPEDRTGSIENLFSDTDRRKYANHQSSGNSKVLLAITLHDKIEKNQLTLSDFEDETKENFKNLFTRLRSAVSG